MTRGTTATAAAGASSATRATRVAPRSAAHPRECNCSRTASSTPVSAVIAVACRWSRRGGGRVGACRGGRTPPPGSVGSVAALAGAVAHLGERDREVLQVGGGPDEVLLLYRLREGHVDDELDVRCGRQV